MTTIACESCGMPLAEEAGHTPGRPDGRWCRFCAPDGALQPFEERFERMVQWQVQRGGQSRAEAEAATRAHMRTLPAWKDHPALKEG